MARLLDLTAVLLAPLVAYWRDWFTPLHCQFAGPTIPTFAPSVADVPVVEPAVIVAEVVAETPVVAVAPPPVDEPAVVVAAQVGHVSYYPEMDEPKPEAEIEARMSHGGKHWFLRTRLTLPTNRGVKFIGKLTAGQLVPGSRLVGWNEYKVTNRAFEILSQQHRIVSESLL